MDVSAVAMDSNESQYVTRGEDMVVDTEESKTDVAAAGDLSQGEGLISDPAALQKMELFDLTRALESVAKAGDVVKLAEMMECGHKDIMDAARTALVAAAANAKWDCVKLLVKLGVDVTYHDYIYNLPALNNAAMHDNLECVDLLIKAGADVNYLFYAAPLHLTDDARIAELLIKAGADVNRMTYDDCRVPLEGAAYSGNVDLVKVLIKAGADVNHSMDGSPLEIAVGQNHVDCVKLLACKARDLNRPFEKAMTYGSLDCAKELIKAGASRYQELVNVRFNNKMTPLMKAAVGGHLNCIEHLIKLGASTKAVDTFGNNMLMFASLAWQLEAMKYCIHTVGLSVNVRNKLKETPLMKITAEADTRDIKRNRDQNQRQGTDCIKLLVKSGADVNKRNTYGDTALNTAAKVGKIEHVKILLEAGVHINVFNKTGCNAVMSYRNASAAQNENDSNGSKEPNEELKLLLMAAGESRKQFSYTFNGRGSSRPKESRVNGCFQFLCVGGSDGENGGKGLVVIQDIEWNCWKADKLSEEIQSLKQCCREAIRKFLLLTDPFTSLFQTVPMLSLPQSITSYLLYEVQL